MKKKTVAILITIAILVAGVVGFTVAWLIDKTEPVVNTFSPSDINITLEESEELNLKMVPGHTIKKDPVVTVEAGSEAAWLFVKLEKSANFADFMTYDMAAGWIALGDAYPGVYYREVAASTTDQEFHVLENDKVTVKNTVTKEMMNDLTGATYPTLTVTAYASQYYESNGQAFAAAEAWSLITP